MNTNMSIFEGISLNGEALSNPDVLRDFIDRNMTLENIFDDSKADDVAIAFSLSFLVDSPEEINKAYAEMYGESDE